MSDDSSCFTQSVFHGSFCFFSYAEYMVVPDIEYLIKIPETMPLSVAAMLPSGALWALNTVQKVERVVQKINESRGPDGMPI